MSTHAATSVSSLTLADLHRLFIAECCVEGKTTVSGLYDAYYTYKKTTPGKARASLHRFMTNQYPALADKYNKLNPMLNLNAKSMKHYMGEMKKKEEEQSSVPPGVQAWRTGGRDEVSVFTDDVVSHYIDKVAQAWRQENGFDNIVDLINTMTMEERLSCVANLDGFMKKCHIIEEAFKKTGATSNGKADTD